ncbi:MAG: phage tail protein [Myxococcales bacterium]|nr:phage tail protein [Myxococcales bacterium]
MAERERPYLQFNFNVTLGDREAGFQEVSGLGTEFNITEYRNGNEPVNAVRKLTGLAKASDVTFKRGVIGTKDLYDLIKSARDSNEQNEGMAVTIELKSEDRLQTALKWHLKRARIMKYTAGPLNATGTEVAMEELVLACEQLEMED